jgi:hypothetical protein
MHTILVCYLQGMAFEMPDEAIFTACRAWPSIRCTSAQVAMLRHTSSGHTQLTLCQYLVTLMLLRPSSPMPGEMYVLDSQHSTGSLPILRSRVLYSSPTKGYRLQRFACVQLTMLHHEKLVREQSGTVCPRTGPQPTRHVHHSSEGGTRRPHFAASTCSQPRSKSRQHTGAMQVAARCQRLNRLKSQAQRRAHAPDNVASHISILHVTSSHSCHFSPNPPVHPAEP